MNTVHGQTPTIDIFRCDIFSNGSKCTLCNRNVVFVVILLAVVMSFWNAVALLTHALQD